MSGNERFSFHQAEEINGYCQRRRVQGAPYVLCLFATGVLLMGVGTFITTHALEKHESDAHILIIIGPILLGAGGIFLLCSVIFCIVACYKNSHLQDEFSDDLFSIGGSTFYGGRGFAYLVNEDPAEPPNHMPRLASEGILNLAGPATSCNREDEAVILLANTVAEERNRQRKLSQKLLSSSSLASAAVSTCPCGTVPCNHLQQFPEQNAMVTVPRVFSVKGRLDHLGLERLHRVDPYPELARDFDLGEGSLQSVRDRSASVYNRQFSAYTPDSAPHRLRRNVTYTASSRARIATKLQQDAWKQKQQDHQQQQQDPTASPQWRRFGSLQRKPRERKDSGAQESIKIHQLPKYDPHLLSALGITPASRDPQDADYNGDPALQPGLVPKQGSQSPQMSSSGSRSGSLRRPPHRQPSMGVKGLKAQQAGGGSANRRHKTSVYASDMSLYRSGSEGMMTQHETIPEDAYLHQQERFASRADRPIHMSSSYTQGSTSEGDSNTPMKTSRNWSLSSSPSPPESPKRPLKRAESHNSSQPKSSVSSNCSCRSERCSDNSCSDCEAREKSKRCEEEEEQNTK
ncbi:uncharacterized protein LOC135223802 isoform X2 [Macrobrachium nipponense]|uniref:uncharacterized protein LOC135223802 isoform X2 n=1 Tax=Macrobrachium nipponense TaxID=159736 RepID=UPI0030C87975